MPDKHEVDGSIPFEPTITYYIKVGEHIEKYIDEYCEKKSKRTRKRIKILMNDTLLYMKKNFYEDDEVIFDLL